MEDPQREMPRYKSHKEVWALKIKEIVRDSDADLARRRQDTGDRIPDGSILLIFEEDGYAPLRVDHAYRAKHEPKAGGYYVVYADGYKSWSPAEAFEEGYTRC